MADGRSPLIAESPAMRPVLQLIARVGPSDANVLITGENGTGKGLVAQALHAVSARASRPMVTVNAGGMAEGVFESELFGHVRGAFTDAKADRVGRFELADGGTLFLDEIANVPIEPAGQAAARDRDRRVRARSARRGRARWTCASSRPPTPTSTPRSTAGRFRQDLLFRLNTIEIHLPPLRDRREDIPLLASHFLRQHAQRYRKALTGFDPAAMQVLLDHRWPGNVRELDHADRARRADGAGRRSSSRATSACGSTAVPAGRLEDMSLEEVEALPDQEGDGPLTATSARRPGARACRAARSTGGWSATSCKLATRRRRRSAVRLDAILRHEPTPLRPARRGAGARRRPARARPALLLLWTGDYSAEGAVDAATLLVVDLGSASRRRCATRVVAPLQTLANLLAALREDDFSIRGRGAAAAIRWAA